MAKNVPASFQDLKKRAVERIQNGDRDVRANIIEMGDAMLEAGVEAKTAQDRLAQQAWKASGPKDKEVLAGMVEKMAKDEAELS
ncbi:MAG: DUF3243 family protein [Thermaerobacter sp.]|nr:DUF3243 family protein [Thermaerobacter sp.]